MAKIDVRYDIDTMEDIEEMLQEREYVSRRSNAGVKENSKAEGSLFRKDKRNKVVRGKDKFFNEAFA
ncbi:hypothetical protein [Ralstonia phage RSP15]|uniref:hypothetical protein n=1 Tax=Ralstonia phage RSP15 TaxID=1785960 RepID=UPI00074D4C95|nr:hypothetical protein BH754_gp201 [Ralstonia phage RSP15]BAU40105.1 hypothetical protein [Ralstonia phage RSP15]